MALLDTPYLQSVGEREMDFLLLEEFHSEPAFVTWFVSHVLGTPLEDTSEIGAWHSISDAGGESDLVLLAKVGDATNAILIENKLDALPQPEQANRYVIRGEAGRNAGDWQVFHTCIVAPKRYLDMYSDASKYDARLSYEAILEWMRTHLSPTKRTAWKIRLLMEAIEQNRRGRTTRFDERVTAFFRAYWEFAKEHFAELQVFEKRVQPAAGAWFQEFRPAGLRRKETGCSILHEFPDNAEKHRTYIYLPDSQPRFAELVALNAAIITDGMQFVRVGKQGVGLSVSVPPLRTTNPFDDQIGQVRAALKAAYRLLILFPLLKLPK